MTGKLKSKEKRAGIMFTLPFTLGFLFFLVVPMAMSFYYSLCEYNILSPPEFIGLTNYMSMAQDKNFLKTLQVTFFYAVVSVPLKLLFALIVALLLLKNTRISAFYRAAYYLPSIIGGSVAVSILWKRLFAIDGVVNHILRAIGIDSRYAWLGSTKTAMWVLILLTVWQFGSSMLIFLASLKQIPSSLYDAAMVDGAGPVTKFFYITLPLLTPTIFFNLIMQMMNGFLAFTQCYIITEGKPMNSTLLYAVYMYQQSFQFYRAGYGAALAWVMVIILSIVTGLLFVLRKYWVYEGGL